MTFSNRRAFLFLSMVGLFFLAGCSVSLASDITPPPNSESFSAQDAPVATESIFPIVPPDVQNGKLIFTEKCAPCHGGAGLGDGPQSGDLPVPVPALADQALAASIKPVNWYNMVTNGNIERYMPGFKSLDDRQRWDVVAYALSLSITSEAKDAGALIYQENCLSCHGEGGEGGSDAPNWQMDSGRLAQLSLDEIFVLTANGVGEMPGFSVSLSAQEIYNVAVYVRSLSFANEDLEPMVTPVPTSMGTPQVPSGTSIPAGTAEAFPPPNIPDTLAPTSGPVLTETLESLTISGKVLAEAGVTIPADLNVTLAGFDGMSQAFEAKAEVSPDGTYEFTDVEFVPGRAYMATMDYKGLTFSSDVYHSPEQQTDGVVDLSINYYETTTDSSALRAERMHIFFDFTRADVVQVVELFILNNNSNKAVIASESGGGVLAYDLPEGATNLQFQDGAIGGRYIQTTNGFADTASILPGEGSQILFAYDLPYDRKMKVSIPIPLPVDAAVIMLPTGSMKVASDQLQSTGSRDVQGINLDMYTASNLKAASTLEMTLSGKVSTSPSLETGNTTGLLIGGGVLGLVLIGAGIWLWRQRKPDELQEESLEALPAETAEEIMDAIITLDDRYKAGDLPEEAYQARRAELKARLSELMN